MAGGSCHDCQRYPRWVEVVDAGVRVSTCLSAPVPSFPPSLSRPSVLCLPLPQGPSPRIARAVVAVGGLGSGARLVSCLPATEAAIVGQVRWHHDFLNDWVLQSRTAH
jgi:hypothetical protein